MWKTIHTTPHTAGSIDAYTRGRARSSSTCRNRNIYRLFSNSGYLRYFGKIDLQLPAHVRVLLFLLPTQQQIKCRALLSFFPTHTRLCLLYVCTERSVWDGHTWHARGVCQFVRHGPSAFVTATWRTAVAIFRYLALSVQNTSAAIDYRYRLDKIKVCNLDMCGTHVAAGAPNQTPFAQQR